MCKRDQGWIIALALLLNFSLCLPTTATEIYRWVDEQGNVHFGDKPRDAAQAEGAEQVEIEEAYQPPERSEEELEILREEQKLKWQRATQRRQKEQQDVEQQRAETQQRKDRVCAEYEKEIRALSEPQNFGGRPGYYFAVDGEGNSLSVDEQRAYVERLKTEAVNLGCPHLAGVRGPESAE